MIYRCMSINTYVVSSSSRPVCISDAAVSKLLARLRGLNAAGDLSQQMLRVAKLGTPYIVHGTKKNFQKKTPRALLSTKLSPINLPHPNVVWKNIRGYALFLPKIRAENALF